jgi:hypothetical protein
MLAAGFAAAGCSLRIATDLVNSQVVLATTGRRRSPAQHPDRRRVHAPDGSDGATPLVRVEAWRRQRPPITHVIAIERCGPSRDGCPRDARAST